MDGHGFYEDQDEGRSKLKNFFIQLALKHILCNLRLCYMNESNFKCILERTESPLDARIFIITENTARDFKAFHVLENIPFEPPESQSVSHVSQS